MEPAETLKTIHFRRRGVYSMPPHTPVAQPRCTCYRYRGTTSSAWGGLTPLSSGRPCRTALENGEPEISCRRVEPNNLSTPASSDGRLQTLVLYTRTTNACGKWRPVLTQTLTRRQPLLACSSTKMPLKPSEHGEIDYKNNRLSRDVWNGSSGYRA